MMRFPRWHRRPAPDVPAVPDEVEVPGLGGPSDEYRPVCLYGTGQGAPRCHQPATTHVAIDPCDDTDSIAVLPTCDRHVDVARACGPLLGEHPYRGWCGLPGTIWAPDWSRCLLDGSGPDRLHAAAALPAPAGTGAAPAVMPAVLAVPTMPTSTWSS